MLSAIFDTLDFAKKLESKGVPVIQAEAHAEYLKEVLEATIEPLTNEHHENKNELNTLSIKVDKLNTKVEKLNIKVDKGFVKVSETIAKLETRLIKWMIGLMVTFSGFLYAALTLTH